MKKTFYKKQKKEEEMEKEKIEKLLEELVKDVSAKVAEIRSLLKIEKSPKLKLEEENFRVDSSGWKEKRNQQEVVYLENPGGNIWEYVDGVPEELVGEQLFTWPAAMRETEKVGKRMPTDEEFNQFQKEDFGQIPYSGLRNADGSFNYLSTYTYFWSSTVSGSNAWIRHLHSSYSTVYRYPYYQANSFSVRCLKD
ncbi:MAG: hypothetical protein U9P50_03595 [Patescibacteria group bacterium]|nr:hypothetical protein [Patescibacteria group bacterium]